MTYELAPNIELLFTEAGDYHDRVRAAATSGFTAVEMWGPTGVDAPSTPKDLPALKAALDGRDPILAFGMNGQPLPREHGFPVRLLTPGLYGYVGSTKWLTKLTLTTFAAQEAYWTKRKWAIDAPIKLSSRVDTPAPLSTIKAGDTLFSQTIGAAGRLANASIQLVRILLPETVSSLAIELRNNRLNDGFGIHGATVARVAPVPVPPAALLLVSGAMGLVALRRRRRAA